MPSSPGSTTTVKGDEAVAVAATLPAEAPPAVAAALSAGATRVSGDVTTFLWLLKLGALANVTFFVLTPSPFAHGVDPWIIVPAQVFFGVSAFRCLFPVRYELHVIFHENSFSSIFWTRVLATFSEVFYIFQFSHVLRLLNAGHVPWVEGASWIMVAAVVISQCFVWSAVLSENFKFYYFEELGWVILFAANTVASLYLDLSTEANGGRQVLLQLSLLYAIGYLPFQIIHLAMLRGEWKASDGSHWRAGGATFGDRLASGLRRAVRVKRRHTDLAAWGGVVGIAWMTGYFATVIPIWVFVVVRVLAFG